MLWYDMFSQAMKTGMQGSMHALINGHKWSGRPALGTSELPSWGGLTSGVCVCVQVVWTQGSTQGGSSGSPLIDAKTRRIVGVLTGGLSTCDTRGSPDYFGRLAKVCLLASCGPI